MILNFFHMFRFDWLFMVYPKQNIFGKSKDHKIVQKRRWNCPENGHVNFDPAEVIMESSFGLTVNLVMNQETKSN